MLTEKEEEVCCNCLPDLQLQGTQAAPLMLRFHGSSRLLSADRGRYPGSLQQQYEASAIMGTVSSVTEGS